jgi:hypothetical protein
MQLYFLKVWDVERFVLGCSMLRNLRLLTEFSNTGNGYVIYFACRFRFINMNRIATCLAIDDVSIWQHNEYIIIYVSHKCICLYDITTNKIRKEDFIFGIQEY